MILQAYDFYQLHKNNKCILQIGGSDQWGNIVNGIDLVRRISQKEVYGLTSPLITVASGAKMGKTEKGAIWLNEDHLSSYDYWQFWRNTDDRDVKRFILFFTDIDTEELKNIFKKEKNINNLKILLANEATKLLHGSSASKNAEQTAKDTFAGKGLGSDLPSINIKSSEFKKGISIIDLIANNKILSSKSEVRRAIVNKGFKVNDIIVENEKKIIKLNDFKDGVLKLSHGKKKHYLVKII